MKVHVFRLRHVPADVSGNGGETGSGFCRLNHANESAFCCQLNADPAVKVMFPSAGTLAESKRRGKQMCFPVREWGRFWILQSQAFPLLFPPKMALRLVR